MHLVDKLTFLMQSNFTNTEVIVLNDTHPIVHKLQNINIK